MKREIKFRGKRVDNGKWIYGGLSIYNKLYKKDKKEHMFIVETGKDNLGFITLMKEVIPETIGQFTGLKDKNGKEIYENDIILDNYGEKNIVIFDYNWCGFCRVLIKNRGYTTIIEDGVEVIGSVHDNPQLLEEEGK